MDLEWPTHLLSGITAGYLITNDWQGFVIGGAAALIPDLDEPKSKFGKLVPFVSVPLNKLFGHRTFTHSLLFVVFIGLLVAIVQDAQAGLIAMAGVVSLIVGDMLTGKVKLMYPLKKSYGVLIPKGSFLIIDRITFVSLCVILGMLVMR